MDLSVDRIEGKRISQSRIWVVISILLAHGQVLHIGVPMTSPVLFVLFKRHMF